MTMSELDKDALRKLKTIEWMIAALFLYSLERLKVDTTFSRYDFSDMKRVLKLYGQYPDVD